MGEVAQVLKGALYCSSTVTQVLLLRRHRRQRVGIFSSELVAAPVLRIYEQHGSHRGHSLHAARRKCNASNTLLQPINYISRKRRTQSNA